MSSEEIIEKNKALVDDFPFLLPRNRWTGKVPDDYDYSYTELDAMHVAWDTRQTKNSKKSLSVREH